MAVNKNFVVKNGLEVNENLILANADDKRVGIASTTPNYTLDVSGGIGATDLVVSGFTTLTQDLQVGTSGSTFYVSDSTSNVGVLLGFSNVTEGSADITYNSDMDVYGFQFTVSGVSNLGASSALGDVSVAGNLVLGFSMTGDFLAAGEGTLASLTFDPTLDAQTLSLSSVLVSGIGGYW